MNNALIMRAISVYNHLSSGRRNKLILLESNTGMKVQVNFIYNTPRRPRGGVDVYLYSFINLGVRWGWVVNTTPRPHYPQEWPGTHCLWGRVGPRAGMDGCRTSRPPPRYDPRTVQPVANRCTDCAVPAHQTQGYIKFHSTVPICVCVRVGLRNTLSTVNHISRSLWA